MNLRSRALNAMEYFGITLERAAKKLDALSVRLRAQVAIEPLQPYPVAEASLWPSGERELHSWLRGYDIKLVHSEQ